MKISNSINDGICAIRRAAPNDIDTIAHILCDAFAEYKSCYTEGAFCFATPSAYTISARWKEGPVWVASLNGKVVGTIAAVPNKTSLYIRSLGVLPEARGHGIGLLLIHEVELFGKQSTFHRLCLSTTHFLQYALHIYEQSGFVQTTEAPHELQGMPLFTMEKLL